MKNCCKISSILVKVVGYMDIYDGIALKLVYLAGIIFICMALVGVVIKVVPVLKPLKNLLLSLAGLFGAYIWYKLTF